MWNELLPKMVGGTLTDKDGPDEPTEVVGYELTDDTVIIKCKDFDFGGQRRYFGIHADKDGIVHVVSTLGLHAIVRMPK